MKKLVIALMAIGICSSAVARDEDHVSSKVAMQDYRLYLPGHGHTLQTTLSSNHDIYLSNPTDHDITYHYTYVLCLLSKPQHCEQNGFIKTLKSMEIYQENYISKLTHNFNYPDKLTLYGVTQIEGEFKTREEKFSQVNVIE